MPISETEEDLRTDSEVRREEAHQKSNGMSSIAKVFLSSNASVKEAQQCYKLALNIL